MVKFKITSFGTGGKTFYFYNMLVGNMRLTSETTYTRESDARRGAKRVAKNLGIVYEEIK